MRDHLPPKWVERLVREEIPAQDDYGLLKLETLVRFAQVCSLLPQQTPKPLFGVGDDATIGAEWDLGRFHLEIQVGNKSELDSIVFEEDGGAPRELPLEGNVGTLVIVMAAIIRG
ncbi:MAG: hypothetical protein ACRDRG_17820 [Pseudonocardiaceae bacterium]